MNDGRQAAAPRQRTFACSKCELAFPTGEALQNHLKYFCSQASHAEGPEKDHANAPYGVDSESNGFPIARGARISELVSTLRAEPQQLSLLESELEKKLQTERMLKVELHKAEQVRSRRAREEEEAKLFEVTKALDSQKQRELRIAYEVKRLKEQLGTLNSEEVLPEKRHQMELESIRQRQHDLARQEREILEEVQSLERSIVSTSEQFERSQSAARHGDDRTSVGSADLVSTSQVPRAKEYENMILEQKVNRLKLEEERNKIVERLAQVQASRGSAAPSGTASGDSSVPRSSDVPVVKAALERDAARIEALRREIAESKAALEKERRAQSDRVSDEKLLRHTLDKIDNKFDSAISEIQNVHDKSERVLSDLLHKQAMTISNEVEGIHHRERERIRYEQARLQKEKDALFVEKEKLKNSPPVARDRLASQKRSASVPLTHINVVPASSAGSRISPSADAMSTSDALNAASSEHTDALTAQLDGLVQEYRSSGKRDPEVEAMIGHATAVLKPKRSDSSRSISSRSHSGSGLGANQSDDPLIRRIEEHITRTQKLLENSIGNANGPGGNGAESDPVAAQMSALAKRIDRMDKRAMRERKHQRRIERFRAQQQHLQNAGYTKEANELSMPHTHMYHPSSEEDEYSDGSDSGSDSGGIQLGGRSGGSSSGRKKKKSHRRGISQVEEMQRLQIEHQREMAKMKFDMERLEQQSKLEELKKKLEADRDEKQRLAEHERWVEDQKRAIIEAKYRKQLARDLPLMQNPASSGPGGEASVDQFTSAFDPNRGFSVYFDYILGLPSRASQIQLAYAFYDGLTPISSIKAMPLSDCEPHGIQHHRCILAYKRAFTDIPPLTGMKLLIEVQLMLKPAAGPHERPKMQPLSWTIVPLFDKPDNLCSGRVCLPMFWPPLNHHLDAQNVDMQCKRIPKQQLFLRLVNAADIAVQSRYPVNPDITQSKYSIPVVYGGDVHQQIEEESASSVVGQSVVADDAQRSALETAGKSVNQVSVRSHSRHEEDDEVDGKGEEDSRPPSLQGSLRSAVQSMRSRTSLRDVVERIVSAKALLMRLRRRKAMAFTQNERQRQAAALELSRTTHDPTSGLGIHLISMRASDYFMLMSGATGLRSRRAGARPEQRKTDDGNTSVILRVSVVDPSAAGGAVGPGVALEYRTEAVTLTCESRSSGMWSAMVDHRHLFPSLSWEPDMRLMVEVLYASEAGQAPRVLAWSFLDLFSNPELIGERVVLREGQHSVPLYDPQQNLNDVDDMDTLTTIDGCSLSLRIYTRRSMPPEPFEGPAGVPPQAWIGTMQPASEVPFNQRGDGVDVYLDGARGLPDNVSATLLSCAIFTRNWNMVGERGFAVPHPQSDCLNPSYSKYRGYRIGEVLREWDATSTLVLKVETMDTSSSEPAVVGFAALPVFVSVEGEDKGNQPMAPFGGPIALNEGAFQLPILLNMPSKEDICSEESFARYPRVPGATLLVRIVKGPSRVDPDDNSRMVVLSRKKVPIEQWAPVGLQVGAPNYDTRIYDSTRCVPLENEVAVYRIREGRKVLLMSQWLDDNGFGGDSASPGQAPASRILEFVRKRVVSADVMTTRMLDLNFSVPYNADDGMVVSIDGCQSLASDGKSFAKVVWSMYPPGGFYSEPPLTDDVHFTRSYNWRMSEAKTQVFGDGFTPIRRVKRPASGCVLMVMDVRVISGFRVRNGAPTGAVSSLGWTFLPLLFGTGPLQSACMQLPVFAGPVNTSILKALAACADERAYHDAVRKLVASSLTKKKTKKVLQAESEDGGEQANPLDGLSLERLGFCSIFLRLVDAHRDVREFGEPFQRAVKWLYGDERAVRKYNDVPRSKHLTSLIPKGLPSQGDAEVALNALFAKDTNIVEVEEVDED